jgi:hypothetical protein
MLPHRRGPALVELVLQINVDVDFAFNFFVYRPQVVVCGREDPGDERRESYCQYRGRGEDAAAPDI